MAYTGQYTAGDPCYAFVIIIFTLKCNILRSGTETLCAADRSSVRDGTEMYIHLCICAAAAADHRPGWRLEFKIFFSQREWKAL
jgi:hypothetical protein